MRGSREYSGTFPGSEPEVEILGMTAVDAREVDAAARRHTRGRFFVCAIIGAGEPDEPIRSAYKSLGYRLLATEAFFVQPLERIPRPPLPVRSRSSARPSLPRGSGRRRERARSRTSFSERMRRSASTWRSRETTSWAVCEASMRRGQPGARTCMSRSRTGDVESGRRCSRGCCGTTGLAARRARCSSQVTPARFSIRAWAMSGSASC